MIPILQIRKTQLEEVKLSKATEQVAELEVNLGPVVSQNGYSQPPNHTASLNNRVSKHKKVKHLYPKSLKWNFEAPGNLLIIILRVK